MKYCEELILDREEYDLLRTLNTFVSIPGLSSKAMRIICSEDLQVHDDLPEVTDKIASILPSAPVSNMVNQILSAPQKHEKLDQKSSHPLFDYDLQTSATHHRASQQSRNNRLSLKSKPRLKVHDLTELTPRKTNIRKLQ